jgi:predicted nucleotidyltransferase component of viral defense system
MRDSVFFKQAQLILKLLPLIQTEDIFALKGGTAINFFVRNLPRLSVDIDLAFLPLFNRAEAMESIHLGLEGISEKVKKKILKSKTDSKRLQDTEQNIGIIVRAEGITVKIEPNIVIRGSIYPPETRRLVKRAEHLFEMSVAIRTLSKAELYAGKMCAALDRQHPRDLFDIYLFLKHEEIDDATRKAFIVYLISHPRPMVELLSPTRLDIRKTFENEFKGMSTIDITYFDIETAREQLIVLISDTFTEPEIEFLVSFKEKTPKWDLLGLEGVDNLPAVKWKLLNLEKMRPDKHRSALEKLKRHLGV